MTAMQSVCSASGFSTEGFEPVGRVAAFTATKYATGHLYTLDLRSHSMTHLTVSDQAERNKEHDMRALKRQDIQALRQGAAKGRKVLYIWDRAGIDFRQWYQWKENSIYFLSREKETMKLQVLGVHPFDRAAPMNRGVIADELIGTRVGVTLRRVNDQDPESGTVYIYLTNLPVSVPLGLAKRDECSKDKGRSGLTIFQQRRPAAHPAQREVHPLIEKSFGPTHSWAHCLAHLAKIYTRS